MKRRLQRVTAIREHGAGGVHVANTPPYLTLQEGAALLRFEMTAEQPVKAFRGWLARHAVPVLRRGRTVLVERAVLEAVIRG